MGMCCVWGFRLGGFPHASFFLLFFRLFFGVFSWVSFVYFNKYAFVSLVRRNVFFACWGGFFERKFLTNASLLRNLFLLRRINMKTETFGSQKIIVDAPSELHRKFKTLVVNDGSTIKGVIVSLMEGYVENGGLPAKGSENGSPGIEVDSLDQKINDLLEAKLSGLGVKAKDGLSPLKEYSVEPVINPETDEIDETEDPEDKVYRTKPGGKNLAVVEESIVAERGVKAENGLIATGKKVSLAEKVVVHKRISGKMITLIEKAKRGYFDWALDGGYYTEVTTEERDAELAEREKDRLAEGKKEIEDGEEL